jgi:hypothetical protein
LLLPAFFLMQQLESKTIFGLLALLGVGVLLEYTGHLSANATSLLTWLGAAFMSVRGVANVFENIKK